jgi:hypothetical protein
MLECGECNQPPAACEGECEAIAFEPIGDCVAGECVYQPLGGYTCPFGCDPSLGDCREPSQVCEGEPCGELAACGGACVAGSGCVVELILSINGDCVTASCPLDAPHPIGCDVFMSGTDLRGCVAASPSSPTVFFKEGDKCDVGHVSGTLLCSSTPGEVLDEGNCPMNKPERYYSTDPSGCP